MFNPLFNAGWIGGTPRALPWPLRPLQEGDQVERSLRLLGHRGNEVCNVVAHIPDRRIEMAGQPPLGLRIHYEFEGIPEGTIVRIRTQARPARGLRWLVPVLNRLLRRAVLRDLGRLKVLVESGAWRSLTV